MKNVLKISLILFCFIFLLSSLNQSEAILQTLPIGCESNNSSSPYGLLGGGTYSEVYNCIENSDAAARKYLISINDNSFHVENPDNGTKQSTWYDKSIFDSPIGANEWLRWLSITNPDLEVLKVSDKGGIVFIGDIGGAFGIWSWTLDPNDNKKPPKEDSLVDFFAGPQANEDFVKYIRRGNNYKNSKLQVILDNWASNPSSEWKIRAILPNKCKDVDANVEEIVLDNPNEDQIKNILHPVDPQKDQPQCFTDVLQNDNELLNILIQIGADNFLLYGSELDRQDISPMWDWYINNSQRDNKWFTWFAMIMVVDCEEVAELSGGGTVLVCPGNIYCFRNDTAEPYIPLDLLNKKKQLEFCSRTLRNYAGSEVEGFINRWIDRDEKFKIISYFEPKEFLKKLSENKSLIDNLDLPISDPANSTLLLEKKDDPIEGSFYLFKNKGITSLDTRWSGVLHKYRNDYLARLIIALGDDLKIINEFNNTLTLGILYPEPKVIAWKFDPFNISAPPKEYSPLDSLYGSEDQKREIVNAITQNVLSSSGEHPLQQIIESYFDTPTPLIIRQVFPKDFSGSTVVEYSPLNILGGSHGSSVLPLILKEALESNTELDFLIQEGQKFVLLNEVNPIDTTMGNLLLRYENPWIAWVTLADNNLETIAKRDSNSKVEICLVSGSDRGGHFWGLTFDGLNMPSEYKVLDSSDKFTLTGNTVEEYITSLPNQATKKEKAFFLDHLADFELGIIKLADIVSYTDTSLQRILLWHSIDSISILQLNRAGYTVPIYIDLVNYTGQNSLDSNWAFVASSYTEDWFAGRIKQEVVNNNGDHLKLWVGVKRLGIEVDNNVAVFLSPPKRSFGFSNINSLKSFVDDFVFKPMERSNRKPTREEFFKSWVAKEWDEETWRANPLGYFDRVNLGY